MYICNLKLEPSRLLCELQVLPQSSGGMTRQSISSALTEEDWQFLELVKKMNQEKVVSKGCLAKDDPIGSDYRGGANFINAGSSFLHEFFLN
jgi:hypothetical protein